ncbi:MAG: antitoxin [Deltaproteobacteria bacterium]|nr:antitoxin [Deltaproteobacteria bacterium]
MKRTQIQLPDPLYESVKKTAARLDWSIAELIRRGAEYMVQCYADAEAQDLAWQPPAARKLGEFLAPQERWREIANDPTER